ncbi:hypothetical protein AAF712_004513 [Marasmius tenuissimus]|uniref:Uncharacterized protein n=1 Tax=Marasmius tenuissimus TaxID=585030 RepID=A0ABR3A4K7_9AGAR
MKLPSSSSLIFATLAVSSSSSSLAAPTSDVPPSAGGLSASTSNKNVRSPMRDQVSMSRRAEQDQQGGTVEASSLLCDTVGDVLGITNGLLNTVGGIVKPIPLVGDIAGGVLHTVEGLSVPVMKLINCPNGVQAALAIANIEDPQGGSQESASARSFDPDQSDGPSTPPPSPDLSGESHSSRLLIPLIYRYNHLSIPLIYRCNHLLTLAHPPVQPPVDPSHPPVHPPIDPTHPPVDPPVDPAHPPVTPPVQPPVDPSHPPVQLPVKPPVEPPVKAAGEDMPTSSSSSAQGRVTPVGPPKLPVGPPEPPVAPPEAPVEPPVKPPVKLPVGSSHEVGSDSSLPVEPPVSPPVQQKNIRRGIHPVRTTKQTAGKVKNSIPPPVGGKKPGMKGGARDSADTPTGPQRRSRFQARSDSKDKAPVSPDDAPHKKPPVSPGDVADHAPVKPPVPGKHRHHHSSSETATSTVAKETFTDTAKHSTHTHASS